MAKRTVGKARGTTVRLSGGATTIVYAGAPVPDNADPDDVARLLEEDYLTEEDVAQSATDDKPSKGKSSA